MNSATFVNSWRVVIHKGALGGDSAMPSRFSRNLEDTIRVCNPISYIEVEP